MTKAASADENTRELYKVRLKSWRDEMARGDFREKKGIEESVCVLGMLEKINASVRA